MHLSSTRASSRSFASCRALETSGSETYILSFMESSFAMDPERRIQASPPRGPGQLGVELQEVVSGLRQPACGCEAADSEMRSMPIVVMVPSLEHRGALRRVVVGDTVGPLSKCGLDKALGLAVGLGPVRSREGVAHAQAFAGLGEAFVAKHTPVVGQHLRDGHAEALVIPQRLAEERYGVGAALALSDLCKCDPRMIVDRDKQILPAGHAAASSPLCADSVAQAIDASQLLGIDVQQIAGMCVLVAHHRGCRFEVGQTRDAGSSEHSTDRRDGYPDALGDPGLGEAAMSQLDD